MKIIVAVVFLLVSTFSVQAQQRSPDGGGLFNLPEDNISQEERDRIQAILAHNSDSLRELGLLKTSKVNPVKFSWPLQAADHLFDSGYHGISNFVDLNPSFPNILQDYNCGTRSYDTNSGYNHAGIDYFTWPFSINKMNDNDVEIIAAAPGTIISKSDGNADRSCSLNGEQWNAVYVEHEDGTVAWYGHMKVNSLTEKGVGETVERGEYLGQVGSSGNSTGPHLHLEFRTSAGFGSSAFDPYKGPCNQIPESLWEDQHEYYDSKVNAIRTHSQGPELSQCPQPDNPYYKDAFKKGDPIVYAVYFRDQLQDQQANFRVRDASNLVSNSWSFSQSNVSHYSASYWYWTNQIAETAAEGLWQLEIDFEGETYSHSFTVSDPATPPTEVFLRYPENDIEIVDEDITLYWLPLADAQSYEIEIAADPEFNDIILTQSNLLVLNMELTQNDMVSENYWRVRATNANGTGEWSESRRIVNGIINSVDQEDSEIPTELVLKQNFPNPFNPSTLIEYSIPVSSFVELTVYDLSGRIIESLVSSNQSAGNHQVNFNASNLASGIYIYQLRANGLVVTNKMTLIK